MAFLGQKRCFLGKKCTITWDMLHILLNKICKFAISHKNDAFFAKIVNTRLTKIFMALFATDERLPSSATLPAVLKTKPTRSSEMNVAPDINNHLRSRDLFGSMIILNNRSKVRDDHEIRTIPLRMPFFDAWVSSCLRKKDSVLQIARDSKVENCTTQKKIDYLL